MLKSVRLKNFKLHEDTLIEAAPITVFIGPNNSGKSSIFQALLLLRQAASRNDQFLCQPPGAHLAPSEPYQYSPQLTVDVGRFEETVRDSGQDFHFEFTGFVRARKPVGRIEQATVNARLRVRKNQLVYHDGSLETAGTETRWQFVQGRVPVNTSNQQQGVKFWI